MQKNATKIFIILSFFVVSILLVVLMVYLIDKANRPEPVPEINQTELELNESQKIYNKLLFDYKMVRKTNNYYNDNYLISPLSIAYMLKVLEEGAGSETRGQFTTLIKNYDLPKIVNIDKKISIATALFINTVYKGKINNNYVNSVAHSYNANTMYDSFTSTDGINNWVNGKTFGQITRAVNSLDRNAKFAIVNTIALNIDWKQKMNSINTHKATFTKIDNTPIEVAMMSDKNAFGYLDNANAYGIVKHFAAIDKDTGGFATAETANKLELEYIALIPKTDINDYVNNTLDQYELSKLLSTVKVNSSTTDLVMNIPKYYYAFGLDNLKLILNENDITKAFDPESADFSGINNELYLTDTLHRTYLELGENGTMAADVSLKTQYPLDADEGKEKIEVNFNKPFIYLIKEKNSTNLWMFGIVYEPMLWDEYAKLIETAQREAERAKRGY